MRKKNCGDRGGCWLGLWPGRRLILWWQPWQDVGGGGDSLAGVSGGDLRKKKRS